MQCRICGNQCMERELVHECRAGGITKLLRHAPYTIKKDNVALYECSNCGHIQTQYLLNQDFYDDYADFNGAIQYYGDKIVLGVSGGPVSICMLNILNDIRNDRKLQIEYVEHMHI